MRGSIVARIVTFFLGACAVLCIMEAGLSLGNAMYRHARPCATAQKKADSFVVLCIGDSFVSGLGAPADKSYPRQLEEMLNQAGLHRPVSVINSGEAGKNIDQILERFLNDVDAVRPDLVIFLGGQICKANLYGYRAFIEGQTFRGKLLDYAYSIRAFKFFKYVAGNIREKRAATLNKLTDGNGNVRRESAPPPVHSPVAIKYYEQGLKYSETTACDKAIECFKRSIALCPEQNHSFTHLGLIYELKHMDTEALKCYEDGFRWHVQYCPEILYRIGQLYYQKKDFKNAYAAFCTGVERKPCRSDEEFNGNFEGLMLLYRTPEARQLHHEVRGFLNAMNKKTNEHYRNMIESLDTGGYHPDIRPWAAKGINTIIDICQRRSIPVILQGYPEGDWEDFYECIAQERGVPFVSHKGIFEELLAKNPRSAFISNDNMHCNANGYRVMARNIYTAIMKMDVIK